MNPQRKRFTPWLFALPALLVFALLNVYPTLFALQISLSDWDGLSAGYSWVGFGNYLEVVRDPDFLRATFNTFAIVGATVVLQSGLAFVLALGIEGVVSPVVRGIYRTLFYLPALLAYPVVGIIWGWMFDPFDGPINLALGNANLPQPLWLGEYPLNLAAILVANLWMWIGYNALIFSAGIQAMPRDVLEAARMDGASGWTLMWRIVLPLLRPITAIVVVTTMINGLKIFDLIWVLTGGGPADRSHTWATLLYKWAFTFGEYGQATALGFIMFGFSLVLTIIYLRMLGGRA